MGVGKKIADPRQVDLIRFYTDPSSPTFGDMKNSAMRAQYSEQYADNITNLRPKWLLVSMGRRERMLVKAERNLDEVLDLDVDQEVITKEGLLTDEEGKPIKRKNAELLKIKQDASKFIAKTVGKKIYSEDTPNVTAVQVNIMDDRDRFK